MTCLEKIHSTGSERDFEKNDTMRSVCSIAFLLVVALASVTVIGAEGDLPELNQSKAFLTAYCVSCHSNDKSEGDRNFETFSNKEWNDHELINELLTVLKEKEMPPEDAEKKPSAREAIGFEALLAKQYLTIKEKLPGVLTRLNRAEYENTINDAFFYIAGSQKPLACRQHQRWL